MAEAETYNTIANPTVHDIVMLHRWQKWRDNSKLHKNALHPVRLVISSKYSADAMHAARKIIDGDPVHREPIAVTPYFRDVSIPQRVSDYLATCRRNAADPLGEEIARQRAADAELAGIAARRAREHDAEQHRLERVLAKRRRADRGPVVGAFSLLVIAGGIVVDRLHKLDQAEAMELLSARQAGESARAVLVTERTALPAIGEPFRPEEALLGKFAGKMAAAARARGAAPSKRRGAIDVRTSKLRMAALAG